MILEMKVKIKYMPNGVDKWRSRSEIVPPAVTDRENVSTAGIRSDRL
jgi:hypothetical protein